MRHPSLGTSLCYRFSIASLSLRYRFAIASLSLRLAVVKLEDGYIGLSVAVFAVEN